MTDIRQDYVTDGFESKAQVRRSGPECSSLAVRHQSHYDKFRNLPAVK